MATKTESLGSLSAALVQDRTISKDLALIGAGCALTALAAQVRIPWQPVPFTLQTLAVSMIGLTLGSKKGLLSQLLYLALGAVGMPVFAEGKSGFLWMLPTGGYLAGMAIAAWALGRMAEKGMDRKVGSMAVSMLLGNVIIFSLGLSWLAVSTGNSFGWAVANGFAPFAAPELAKAVIAILAMPSLWWLTGKNR